MEVDKIVIVKRQTPLEELLVRYATAPQVRFHLESAGHSYSSYQRAHDIYHHGLTQVIHEVPNKIRKQIVDKKDLATFQFGEKDLVVVVGDDGLLVNTAKYLANQKVISVNPDREQFDGVLSTCHSDQFKEILYKTIKESSGIEALTMAEATLPNGQVMRALNDLFVGRNSHASARYTLSQRNTERQSSSGIIISTGTGSTGWLTSIFTGAYKLANNQERSIDEIRFKRDSEYLLFAVREPFPSKITGTNFIEGSITEKSPLKIESHMPEGGVIFGDGMESDYLEFLSGTTATIRPSSSKVYLITQ